MDVQKLSDDYRTTLLENVIPFWQKFSPDNTYGGYLTSLDRSGNVYDTDKFVWLQGRQVWTFSMLYNRLERRPEWLDLSLQGARFLQSHGRDHSGNWHFSLTKAGQPLIQPYNIFSDCYASMAFAQLYKATGDPEHRTIAVDTFYNILRRRQQPKGLYTKEYPGTRPLISFSLPMVLCSLVLELEDILTTELVESTIHDGIHTVLDLFYQPDTGLILENVQPDGQPSDSLEGRLLNPGHAIEAMWFIMDLATRSERSGGRTMSDAVLIRKATDIMLNTLEYSWDQQYGGIFTFLDSSGLPPQQLEWDRKLWWVHVEALVGLLKGYLHTGDKRCWDWFMKVHEYTWAHFADPLHGEWFGYLDRQGQVLLPYKGSKWKGCYHLPRALFECWQTLDAIGKKYELKT